MSIKKYSESDFDFSQLLGEGAYSRVSCFDTPKILLPSLINIFFWYNYHCFHSQHQSKEARGGGKKKGKKRKKNLFPSFLLILFFSLLFFPLSPRAPGRSGSLKGHGRRVRRQDCREEATPETQQGRFVQNRKRCAFYAAPPQHHKSVLHFSK